MTRAIRSGRRNKPTHRVALTAAAAGILAAGVLADLAYGHHSFAMYDTRITRTFTGRLLQVIPGANHAQILFEVLEANGRASVDESGQAVRWGVETGPAAQIARQGVTLDAFPAGTIINVNLNPLRDGRNFGALARDGGRLIHCGNSLPEGGCTEATGTVYLEGEN
jgi:hypothetical protein